MAEGEAGGEGTEGEEGENGKAKGREEGGEGGQKALVGEALQADAGLGDELAEGYEKEDDRAPGGYVGCEE